MSNLVRLDSKNQGRATFTVSNRTAALLRGRAQAIPAQAGEESWLTLEGAAERDFQVNITQQYTVKIQVAPGTPTGRHSFRLDMTAVAPALGGTQGQAVVFEVTTIVPIPRAVKKGYVATLVGATLGALVGGLVGAVPGAIVALIQASTISVSSVVLIVGIGALVASIPAVGAGAWVNLRAQGYEGALQTGLILAGIFAAWALLLGVGYAVLLRLTSGQLNVGITLLVALAVVLVPPVPARVIYLWLKSAGRLP
ncbi:MAG TPA: hypothetical protein VJT78_12740 [Candidatus Dormibacteraeota bacterium]|nr:hypothetical protein [Candidatus Dormibacteraeota bacterium]